jgi:hypothetical protein
MGAGFVEVVLVSLSLIVVNLLIPFGQGTMQHRRRI